MCTHVISFWPAAGLHATAEYRLSDDVTRSVHIPGIRRRVRMGGAAGTAGTAAAVPLLREVRQDKVLPYHILVKKNQKHIGDLGPSLANLTKFDPCAMANRFFFN